MSFAAMLNQTISITTMDPGSEDSMGNAELAAAGSAVTSRGRIQQASAQEITVGRDTAISDWVLYLPAGVAIDHQDIVTEGSRTFEVLGSPYPVQTPVGTHHLQVRLRERVG